MEASQIGENEERKIVEEGDVEKENDEEVLKKIIENHPLFDVLIESHIKCLKVGSDEAEDFDITSNGISNSKSSMKKLVNSNSKATTSPNPSELDLFMEAYCMALSKLKEAIEEPTKEAKAFINSTYIQLKELGEANNPQLNFDKY